MLILDQAIDVVKVTALHNVQSVVERLMPLFANTSTCRHENQRREPDFAINTNVAQPQYLNTHLTPDMLDQNSLTSS